MAKKPKKPADAKKRNAKAATKGAKDGKTGKGGRKAGTTAFALAVFVVVAAVAGTAAWLQLTFDPNAVFEIPVAEVDVAPPVTAAKPLDLTAAPPADQTPATADRDNSTPTDTPPAGADDRATMTTALSRSALSSDGDKASLAPPPPVELAPVPDPDLVRDGPNGPLPVIAADGRTALQVYARPHRETGRPRIGIVMGSLGLSRAATTAAIQQLPGAVTLAFAPYGRDLQETMSRARAAGHEVLLQIPMEPVDYPTNDPGPHTLLTSLPARKNVERLEWLMSRLTGYVGVMNYMGSRFTASDAHLRPVLVAVRDRGLMFLDARATSASVAIGVARSLGVPSVANDRYIDDEASRAGIDRRLEELQRLAVANGQAIGLAFPYPVTIERLAQWSRQLHSIHGIDLVPVSALVSSAPVADASQAGSTDKPADKTTSN